MTINVPPEPPPIDNSWIRYEPIQSLAPWKSTGRHRRPRQTPNEWPLLVGIAVFLTVSLAIVLAWVTT